MNGFVATSPTRLRLHRERQARLAKWAALYVKAEQVIPEPDIVPVAIPIASPPISKYRASIMTLRCGDRPDTGIPFAFILDVACHEMMASKMDIKSPRRDKAICQVRQIIMWLGYTMTSLSYSQIGARLGNRDHTTILHGIQKISAEPVLLAQAEALQKITEARFAAEVRVAL